MTRGDRARVCVVAGLATGAVLAAICTLAMDPTDRWWADAHGRWGFVHWPLAARWAYAFTVGAWGFALGALAAWRGRDTATGFARWGVLIAMVLGGGVLAALAVLGFLPDMGSVGSGAGAVVEVAIDFVAVVLFMALHAGLVLFGGALALGVGRLLRALADGLPAPWRTTGAFGAATLVVLLAGGVSPDSLGAPVAVVGSVVLAAVAGWSARTTGPTTRSPGQPSWPRRS